MASSSKSTKNTEFASPLSDFKGEQMCTVCRVEGDTHKPIGYCNTCEEHLCKRCFKGHKVLQSRGHVLLEYSKKPKENYGIDDIVICQFHNFKAIMYHCSDHNFFGCSDCYNAHSDTCQAVVYIPDIAADIAGSRKFRDTRKTMANIAFRSKTVSDGIKRKTDNIERCSRDAKAELDSFKQDLIQAIEEHVEELKETINTVENMEKAKLKTTSDKYDCVQSKAEKIVSSLDKLKNKNNTTELYITLEKGACEVPSLQYELSSGNKDQCMKSFKYAPNHETLELMKKSFTLGDIRTSDIIKVEHIGTIDVKSEEDKATCSINGSTLLTDGRIVVADKGNKKVKMFDTVTHKNVSELDLLSEPWTVTKITDSQFAVSLPEKRTISFVRTGQPLALERELTVGGQCNGLAYGNGLLVVSYMEPCKVEVMDTDGRIVRIIENDNKGQKLFQAPNYVAMSPIDNVVYVSNYSSSNVVCIDIEGDVLYTYKDLRYPRQVIVTAAGQVMVCEESPPVIRMLDKGSKQAGPFLSGENGLTAIGHICHNESEEKLFVSELNKDYIKVFRIIYS